MGREYNLLASLFKKRPIPTIKTSTGSRDMLAEEKAAAEATIRDWIADFAYDDLVKQVNNDTLMKEKFLATDVGYEKI